MAFNLLHIYESFRDILESFKPTHRTNINTSVNKVFKKFLNGLITRVKKKHIEKQLYLNYKSYFDAFIALCYEWDQNLSQGYETDKEIMESDFFKYEAECEGTKIQVYFIPCYDNSGIRGMTNPDKENPKNTDIHIFINQKEVHKIAQFISEPLKQHNREEERKKEAEREGKPYIPSDDLPSEADILKKRQDDYQFLNRFFFFKKSTLAHEIQHYFQYQNKWKYNELLDAYQKQDKLQETSVKFNKYTLTKILAFHSYRTTPQEVDAQLHAAYKLYKYWHRKINYLEALFIIFLESDTERVDAEKAFVNKEPNKDLPTYLRLKCNASTRFFFLWVILVYVKQYSERPWAKLYIEETIEKYYKGVPLFHVDADQLDKNQIEIQKLIDTLYDMTKTKCQRFTRFIDEKYGYSESIRKLFNIETSNSDFTSEMLQSFEDNERTGKKIKKENSSIAILSKSKFYKTLCRFLSMIDESSIQRHIKNAFDLYQEKYQVNETFDLYSALYGEISGYINLINSPQFKPDLTDRFLMTDLMDGKLYLDGALFLYIAKIYMDSKYYNPRNLSVNKEILDAWSPFKHYQMLKNYYHYPIANTNDMLSVVDTYKQIKDTIEKNVSSDLAYNEAYLQEVDKQLKFKNFKDYSGFFVLCFSDVPSGNIKMAQLLYERISKTYFEWHKIDEEMVTAVKTFIK